MLVKVVADGGARKLPHGFGRARRAGSVEAVRHHDGGDPPVGQHRERDAGKPGVPDRNAATGSVVAGYVVARPIVTPDSETQRLRGIGSGRDELLRCVRTYRPIALA